MKKTACMAGRAPELAAWACALLLCSCAIADRAEEWPDKPVEDIQKELGDKYWECVETEGRHYLQYTREGAYTREESYYETEYNPKTKTTESVRKTKTTTEYEDCAIIIVLDENGKVSSSYISEGRRESCRDAFPSKYRYILPGEAGWWENLWK